MPAVVVQREVRLLRGPCWWLAWMTDLPDVVYKGRSAPEAVGRLVMDQEHELPGWFTIRNQDGWPSLVHCDPLTPTEMKQHLKEIAESKMLPPVQGSFFSAVA